MSQKSPQQSSKTLIVDSPSFQEKQFQQQFQQQSTPTPVHATDSVSVTSEFMTRFERAHVIGTRAQQLSYGAVPAIPLGNKTMEPSEIALLELRQNKMPIIIRRYLPDGSHEDWPTSKLKQPNSKQIVMRPGDLLN
ncbi:DNA-directed RNA polymerase subunit omega [bacterium]|nr:DNA-directed RNA polymerase subunit omega [bacterium]